MRFSKVIWFVLTGLMLLSCLRDTVAPEQTQLCVVVHFPELPVTKGVKPVAPELEAEAKINNLRIWVFLHDDFNDTYKSGYRLGYIEPNQSSRRLTENEDRYYIKIPTEIARAYPKVDVFVLANSGGNSLPGSFGGNTTRSYLEEFVMDGERYGITADKKPATMSVPDKGLPYSAVGKNLSTSGTFPTLTVETVALKRTVSKFRIVMSQLGDVLGPVTSFAISDLALDSGLISEAEYVFNDSALPYKISNTYVAQPVVFTPASSEEVAVNSDPESYAYVQGTPYQDYENLVLEGLKNGALTDLGVCYFRETDRKLKGHINYTLANVAGSGTFEMPGTEGMFRNRSWIVYIYFLSNQMNFTVAWTPWEEGQDFEWKNQDE